MTDQTKARKTKLITDYIKQRAHKIGSLASIEEDTGNIYDATYKSTLDAIIKSEGADVAKMIGWYIVDQSLSVPTPFTDAEVDAINPEIRTQAV